MPTPLFQPAARDALLFEAGLGPVDECAMAGLRVQALTLPHGTDWSRHDDHAVIALLQAYATPATAAVVPLFPLTLKADAPAPAPATAPAAAAPRAAAVGAPAPLDAAAQAAAFASVDAARMVQALKAAARDGVPFCEECSIEPAAP